MPDILSLFRRWWRLILGISLVTTGVAAVFLSFLPKQYLSQVTALPASNVEADKSRIFNQNIESLNPTVGLPDDLDKVVGTSKLDTLYYSLVRKHNLVDYYGFKGEKAEYKAVKLAKGSCSVGKSEFGELKIKWWDGSPHMAATLANSFFSELQLLHQQLENRSNAVTFANLRTKYEALQKNYTSDTTTSVPAAIRDIRKQSLQQQMMQYEKLLSEYEVMLDLNPQVLLLVEAARPDVKADKPNWLQALFLVFFASLLFGLAVAILLETTKRD
jgi:uncharacterized protein involved in exopolysaccharide biosynthesis